MGVDTGVVGEGGARVLHLRRLREHHDGTLIGDAVLLEGRDDVEAQTAGIEGLVVLDVRAGEPERDATVGQVQALGHLGIALVDTVPQPHPSAEPRAGVVEVVVRALVEVGGVLDVVHVVVLGYQAHVHGSSPLVSRRGSTPERMP